MQASSRAAALAGGAVWLSALLGFGLALPADSQLQHPMALLGGTGVPHALAFNALALLVPGLCAAFAAWHLRSAQSGGAWGLRIGAQLLLLSAFAFAAQGLLPLDPTRPDAGASRLHAMAWSCWWIAWLAGACALLAAMRGARVRLLGCVGLALLAWGLLPGALAQRLAVACWFLLLVVAAPARASAPGNQP